MGNRRPIIAANSGWLPARSRRFAFVASLVLTAWMLAACHRAPAE
jgi:hypothetical protein